MLHGNLCAPESATKPFLTAGRRQRIRASLNRRPTHQPAIEPCVHPLGEASSDIQLSMVDAVLAPGSS